MKHIFIPFFVLFFLSFPVFAQSDYMVRNIAVDATGDNAIDAKDNALNKARQNGFETLMKRMGVEKRQVSDRVVASLVNSFEINREKSSKNRYRASVNVMFNERAVHAYLGRYTNAPIAEGVGHAAYGVEQNNTPVQGYVAPSVNLQSYKVEIPVSGISQLVSVKDSIQRIPSLGGVHLVSVKSNRAVLDIRYSGDVAGLNSELSRRSMQLANNPMMGTTGVPYVLGVSR